MTIEKVDTGFIVSDNTSTKVDGSMFHLMNFLALNYNLGVGFDWIMAFMRRLSLMKVGDIISVDAVRSK